MTSGRTRQPLPTFEGAVLQYIRKQPGKSITELARAFGIKTGHIAPLLRALEKEGLIKGKYSQFYTSWIWFPRE